MKKNFLFLLAFLCLILTTFSCRDQEEQTTDGINSKGITLTRALSANETSVSNPTLHDNWENVATIKLNGGGEIDAPWIVKAGNSMNIPENYRTDIKKEDGWIMLSHTLLSESSLEPNYILLYNTYRGILKGFYYNRENIKNQSFIWVMEANSPTSIFPLNNLVQGNINMTSNYVTSSNIAEGSQFNFAQLNQGWNAFSFELPYGTISNAPIVAIKGYNNENSTLNLSGRYSGETLIPVTTSQPSSASSIVSAIKGALGVASAAIPVLSTVNRAVSIAASVLGNTSLFKSKTSVTNIRATSSGNLTLAGSSFTLFGGVATSLNNVDLKALNNGNELGVWGLSSAPVLKYPRCVCVEPSVNNDDHFTTSFYCDLEGYPIDTKSLISINPLILNSLSSYSVESDYFTKAESLYFISSGGAPSYHPAGFSYYLRYGVEQKWQNVYVYDTKKFPSDIFEQMLLNITVTFNYKDGSSFISSRVYKPQFQQVDNRTEIINSIIDSGKVISWVKSGIPSPTEY